MPTLDEDCVKLLECVQSTAGLTDTAESLGQTSVQIARLGEIIRICQRNDIEALFRHMNGGENVSGAVSLTQALRRVAEQQNAIRSLIAEQAGFGLDLTHLKSAVRSSAARAYGEQMAKAPYTGSASRYLSREAYRHALQLETRALQLQFRNQLASSCPTAFVRFAESMKPTLTANEKMEIEDGLSSEDPTTIATLFAKYYPRYEAGLFRRRELDLMKGKESTDDQTLFLMELITISREFPTTESTAPDEDAG